jgi:hypothetical protein
MDQFKGLFLIVLGVGVLLIGLQGIARGWLPNGPNGFKQGEGVRREDQPIMFWFFFSLYFGGGSYLVFYALRILAGGADSPPLR